MVQPRKIINRLNIGPALRLFGRVRALIWNKNIKIRIFAVALVLMVVAGGGWFGAKYIQNRNKKPVVATGPAEVKLSPEQEKIANFADALDKKDYDKALANVNNGENPDSKENLILKGITYMAKGDYKLAFDTFRTVEKKYGLDSGLALNLADASVKAGDKKVAFYYYVQALELLKKENSPNYSSQAPVIQKLIQDLSK